MNERIRELIEQATTKQDFYPAGCNGYPDYRYEFDKEKFAELIVQECAHIVEDEDTGDIYGKSARLAMIRIRQHFGVEK